MKVYTRRIQGHRALHYSYRADRYMKFCFHLLCEVGQPWQSSAKVALAELCAETKSKVVTVELDAKPWLIETLVKETP